MRTFLKIALGCATVAAWLAFLCLDAQWSSCLTRAVKEGKQTYGEMYGPLLSIRPVVMYSAFGLSMVCAAWLVIGAMKKGQTIK